MRGLSLAANVLRRGRSDHSGGACLGIDWCVEHGHERDDPWAPSRVNSRGVDVSLLLARRVARVVADLRAVPAETREAA